MVRPLAALLCLTVLAATAHADAPWRARRRPGVIPSERAGTLVEIQDWPAEPVAPATVEASRFASAARELCRFPRADRAERFAQHVLDAARSAAEDPFLVAALAFRMGRCDADAAELGGIGMTSIPLQLHRDALRGGVYRYRVRVGTEWQARERRMDRFPFGESVLRRAEVNLYFAAQLLAVWRDQHATIDASFPQVPHRTPLAHWVWGDRVQSARAEDRVLTDRRRLLQYYGAIDPVAPMDHEGVALGCPLDGCPRVVSSWIGSARDGGARAHRGTDVESVLGEPVRAIADGRVVFAGVDLPGAQLHTQMSPEEINAYDRHALGNGGRYVCVLHRAEPPFSSCSMHLEEVFVSAGQRVVRGERIGLVGRTGMVSSAPHLHLELHQSGFLDASQVMQGLLIGRNPDPPRRGRRR